MWNDSAYANFHQTGMGCFDYQIDGKEAIQLYTGIGRICDYDVFGRHHLMSRIIFIRDNQSGEFWSVNWEPVKKEYTSYTCTHGLGYSEIKNITDGIQAEFRVFVPQEDAPVELWSIKIKNLCGEPRSLSVFAYNQIQFKFKWGFDSYGDMVYRCVVMDKEQNAIVARKHPFIKPHNYLTAYLTSDVPIESFDGSQNAFCGMYHELSAPVAVQNGRCSNTEGSAEATIVAAQFCLDLMPDEKKEIRIIVGATDDSANISEYKNRYLASMDTHFSAMKKETLDVLTRNCVKTPDEQFNYLFNFWIKQATRFGSRWGRWGYKGYRDIVQHGLGVVTFEPQQTKKILKEALRYQFSSGMAVRGWNPIDEKPYSDCALWLIFTLVALVKETGDTAFLKETIPFYDEGEATVLEHITRVLDFLEANKGEREMLLIKFGDWNDSLTGTGANGKGESVWLSMAYAEALSQMMGLAEFIGCEALKAEYNRRCQAIKAAIQKNAWDGDWYLRCIDDNGEPVGSHTNEKGKIFFEPQSWALITGIANEEQIAKIISSCNEMLGTPLGYLLLSPVYTQFDPKIGRISSMEPGLAENGTVYSHLNIWMIFGLLKQGFNDLAYELFKKISPGYEVGKELKTNTLPYMYSNCYFGPEHRNSPYQMEFSWITGSVAWFNHVLISEMMGAKADFDGLVIEPKLPEEWKSCHIKRRYRGCDYEISIENNGKKVSSVTVDGKEHTGNKLPVFKDGKTHYISVVTI